MEMSDKRFVGKNVLITGAATGIGRATALRFAHEGANIALCDIKGRELQETAAMIAGTGQKGLPIVCDLCNMKDLERMIDTALGQFLTFDVLFNNAGIGDTNAYFEDIEADLWDRVYAVNVKAPFFISKRIARIMIDNGIKGRIINTASTEGKTNRGGSIVYASSKSALIGLTQALAVQLAPYEITVNAVCPGLIDTPIWHRADKAMELPDGSAIKMIVESSIESRILKLPRVGTPDDVAGAVIFLASEDAAYMTGQAINVCGGIEMH
ncbi:MAG: SDR family oxidoreductase [Desulfobacterota bacterium]|nr:SDR family oxidoreductase [Thermodesulfobacteriota bacterium]